MPDADTTLKQAIREKAQQDLDAWHEQRKTDIEKQKAKNRLAEASEPEDRNVSATDSSKYVIINAPVL